MTKISDTFFPAINQLQRERTEHGTGLPVNIRTSLKDIAKSSNNRRVLFARENLLPNLENCHLDLTNNCSLIDRKIREQVSQKEIQEDIQKYNQEVQIFRDTVFATMIQLEECGYELSDNDLLVELYHHCEAHVTEMLQDDKKFTPFLNTTLNVNELFLSVNTEITVDSLQHGISELSSLDETTSYDNEESIFHNFGFMRQLLIDANNMVRSYELETQKPLSMDNPLKRLASFSKAMDSEQLSDWISGKCPDDHPIYAAIHGKYYYVHSDGNGKKTTGAVYQYTPREPAIKSPIIS